jgi:DNA-binding MarR family transcriptional regulator
MLSETVLRVLAALDRKKTRAELSDELGYQPKTVTNALTRLSELELIVRDTGHGRRPAVGTDVRCVEHFHALVDSHPHVDFPELLNKSMLELLYYLESTESVTARELTGVTTLSEATVYRLLKTLTNRAMVAKDHGQYRLLPEFERLHAFAGELRHHRHRVRIRDDVGAGTLVWESYDTFLVRTAETLDHPAYLLSGLDAFSEYGLDFFTTSEHYYFYAPGRNTLSPEELACHLLLIDDDARHRKYALLLLAATDASADAVTEAASTYGLEETLPPLHAYLERGGEKQPAGAPPWEEFQTLADEYGVAV